VYVVVQYCSEMKTDQERVSKLLSDTVKLLCRNGLVYSDEIKVQGLLGITVDKNEVFLVHINDVIGGRLPNSKQLARAASASSEPPARKKSSVASSSKVVDLTRVADQPRPFIQQSVAVPGQLPAGQNVAVRKHRQTVPAAAMVPQQQGSPRMQQAVRPRMMVSGSPSQNVSASQFASNYLAQLQQQVARGMSPVRMTSPARQKPVNRRPQEMTPAQTCTMGDDDDDDVVIIGTGHEPLPTWSSPTRKRPLPSKTSSPASSQKCFSPQASRACSQQLTVRDLPTLVDQLSSPDVEGTLVLTEDDIPTSVEDMIMKIAPTAEAVPKKRRLHSAKVEVPPEACAVDSELPAASTEDSAVVVTTLLQQTTTDNGAIVSDIDDASKMTTTSQQKMEENATESLEPFVYTDIACDVVSTE